MSQNIRTVAVIGSGTMGAGIAEVAAMAGQQVLLHDISAEVMTRAIAALRSRLEARVAKGKLSAEACERGLSRIVPVTDIAALAVADLVIEAAAENLDIKKALFGQLGEICPPQTLLTSNTSSISITAIAAGVKHPERVAGLHFFNPAPVMKLVEVVSGVATSVEVVTQLSQCVLAWGKQPVHCQSTPGFIVNRVARPYYAEAWRALEEQVAAPEAIDTALREAGGFPMGPLALTDLIGQDVNFAVTCSVFNAFWQERRFLPSLVQQELVLAGRFGKKSGQGVYSWPQGAAEVTYYPTVPAHRQAANVQKDRDVVTIDAVLLLETHGETAQAAATRLHRPVVVMDRSESDVAVIAAAASNRLEETEKAIYWLQQQGKKVLLIADYPGLLVWRTVAMLVNEALDALQKGVASEADINIAMRLGVNYPHGPLQWGELLGWQRVLELLETCNATTAKSAIALVPCCASARFWRVAMSHNDAWHNARVMYEKDSCAQALGIDIIEMDEGFAVLTMIVTPQMLNGHQTCHGGQLFSLADTAFAYACNSQGLAAVASACNIDFLRPGFAGDKLTATARVKHQGRLTGVYDIEIVNQQQKTVALFRGKSHRIGGSVTGEA